jgi:hypothetical protein
MTMHLHPAMNGPEFLIETQPAYDDPLVIEAGDCLTRPGVPLEAMGEALKQVCSQDALGWFQSCGLRATQE